MIGVAEVNWLAVLVATIASFFIGFLWYSKLLFGNVWMRLSGIKNKSGSSQKREMIRSMFISIVLNLIASFVLANIIYWLNVSDISNALHLALWLWIGFFVPLEANKVLWEGKPWAVYLISIGHHLVALSVSAMILSVWM